MSVDLNLVLQGDFVVFLFQDKNDSKNLLFILLFLVSRDNELCPTLQPLQDTDDAIVALFWY